MALNGPFKSVADTPLVLRVPPVMVTEVPSTFTSEPLISQLLVSILALSVLIFTEPSSSVMVVPPT